ncbi:MAG TPA: hypothetical protein VMW49_03060 [Candidatus Dormibacteraeota bacterium]|nr:hypothetical protein [Candidatus Dormibacteraeota bacterium]
MSDLGAWRSRRFAAGDRATVVERRDCPCGRSLPALEYGTIARSDDMIKMKTQNGWPDAVDTVILAHPAVDEYQGRVSLDDDARQRREIRLALKPGAQAPPEFVDELRGEIERRTNVTLTVRIVPRQELPRFDYRARRWVDERAAGW